MFSKKKKENQIPGYKNPKKEQTRQPNKLHNLVVVVVGGVGRGVGHAKYPHDPKNFVLLHILCWFWQELNPMS